MTSQNRVREVERVEILTLLDNYVDMTAGDNNAMIYRAGTRVKGVPRRSVLAEHGFSAVVRTTAQGRTRAMLFDFGYSEIGAAYNAKVLDVPMGEIEAIALSHGHGDHMGGFRELVRMIGKPGIELAVHPGVFRAPRYVKVGAEQFKAFVPRFTREMAAEAGLAVVEAKEPLAMLGGDVLFLGQIPRQTAFEKGLPNAYYEDAGDEKRDAIEDDTSIVMNLKGRGLVVLSGCAHSGIVNTVRYAQQVTGVEEVHVIMGGFHLNGPVNAPIVGQTIEALRQIAPRYIVPTHCTGRQPIQRIEAEMPDRFILNMSGTRLTFAA